MGYSQHELGRRFRNGKTSGTASNVKIDDRENGTALIGYGHAMYAFRTNDGTIIYFRGWYGYSASTSCQISKMSLRANADIIVDEERSGYNTPSPEEVAGWRSRANDDGEVATA